MADPIITNSTILKINDKILIRFEHNLKNGTMILFNVETEDIWLGNQSSKDLIEFINGKNSIQEIYTQILSKYSEEDFDLVLNALNKIIEDLYNRNFIEIINF